MPQTNAPIITIDAIPVKIPARPLDSHKGMFGHVVVIGGNDGMGGAPRITAETSLRSGAGRTTLITRPKHIASANANLPELMCAGMGIFSRMPRLVNSATVWAIGPGLGKGYWAHRLMRYVLKQPQPIVVDADGLRWLARNPRKHNNWILTPHAGEAAALLGVTPAIVQQNRVKAAERLQHKYGGVVILKGVNTIVTGSTQAPWICLDAGNPGMASPGMGDCLTGLVAALVAQHLSLQEAAILGVWIHAKAGDIAAADGQRGLLASDLLPHIRKLVNSHA